MKAFGKILALCLIMTIMHVNMSMAYPADIDGTDFQKEAELLLTLGILKENSAGAFSPNMNITRADFAVLTAKLLNLELTSPAYTGFRDVAEGYYAASHINAMVSMRIMSGMGGGLFYPENYVSYAEAYTICLRALGYREMAEGSPSVYPSNYYNLANRIGLSTKIKGKLGDNITKGELAILFKSTLETPVYQVVSISADSMVKETVNGQNLLYLSHGIRIAEGQIAGNDITFLSVPSSLPKGRIQINNVVLKAGDTKIDEYLGHYARAYYNYETETIIYYEIIQDKEPLEINAENILSYSDSVLQYEKDDRIISVKIPPNAYIIYNKKAAVTFLSTFFNPETGRIRMIDGNRDGVYDVIFIESYESHLIKSISRTGRAIAFEDGGFLLAEETGKEIIITEADGREIELEDLKAGDVLTVYPSSDDTYKICVRYNKSVSGAVSEIRMGNKSVFFTLDVPTESEPMICRTDSYFKDRYGTGGGIGSLDINSGDYVTFHFNHLDEITAFTRKGADSIMYGYLVNVKPAGGLDEEVLIKIFAEDGKMISTKLDKRVDFYGNELTKRVWLDSGALLDELTDSSGDVVNQLIRFKQNEEGLIVYIDIERKGLTEASNNKNEDYLYLKNTSGNGTVIYYTTQLVFSGVAFLDTNAKVFLVPEANISSAPEKSFQVVAPDALTNGQPYKYSAYNTNMDLLGCSAVVIYSSASSASYPVYDVLCYISKISKVVNSEGAIVHKIHYLKGKSANEAFAEDATLFEDRTVGDAMLLSKNASGEIYTYTLYFDAKNFKLVNIIYPGAIETTTNNPSHGDYNALRRRAFGSVQKVRNGMILIDLDGPLEIHKMPRNLYVLDTKRNTLTEGTLADITERESDSVNYSRMFFFQIYSLDYDALIIN